MFQTLFPFINTEELFHRADELRRENVGQAVHLRGLIELSNQCRCRCAYCGINADNHSVVRYRLTADEVMNSVRLAIGFGYGTIVFQAGEDAGLTESFIADLIGQIKSLATPWGQPLAVTLSLGERPVSVLKTWRAAGADRYLLRFETSNPRLYARLHPHAPDGLKTRIEMLQNCRELGYQIGTGFMVGVPGQTTADWAGDLELLESLQPDMIGLGPYLPHPATSLAAEGVNHDLPSAKNVVLTTVALARLLCPKANIPSTTALAAIDKVHGHEDGLNCGANVIMPNLTPAKYRSLYEIYPEKGATAEEADRFDQALKTRILKLGRTVGYGPGNAWSV